jgi:hypothetical protein
LVRSTGQNHYDEALGRSTADVRPIFARLARYHDIPFMPDGRQQPPMPSPDDVSFDE